MIDHLRNSAFSQHSSGSKLSGKHGGILNNLEYKVRDPEMKWKVSRLNCFNFGRFGGTLMLGNPYMCMSDVHDIYVYIYIYCDTYESLIILILNKLPSAYSFNLGHSHRLFQGIWARQPKGGSSSRLDDRGWSPAGEGWYHEIWPFPNWVNREWLPPPHVDSRATHPKIANIWGWGKTYYHIWNHHPLTIII